MDHFKRIPEEKQKLIINAAIGAFATNGYKKTSINDIAKSAEISKSMVFHYFGNKKALYLFLLEYCSGLLSAEMTNSWSSDFFDRVKKAIDIKLSIMSRYPSLLIFLSSIYSEKDEAVQNEINMFLQKNRDLSNQTAIDGVDVLRFKPDIDIKLVFKILQYFTEGYLSKAPVKDDTDIRSLIKELDECINLLKNNLYKESCL
ncbi:MAG: TetR/AcrR family transcriptional regulator [Eubacteriaceae bacterium]